MAGNQVTESGNYVGAARLRGAEDSTDHITSRGIAPPVELAILPTQVISPRIKYVGI